MTQEEIDQLKTELKLAKTAISDLIVVLSNAEVHLEYDEHHRLEGVNLTIDGLYHIRKNLICTCSDTPTKFCSQYGCSAMMSKEEREDFLGREDDPKNIRCGCDEDVSLHDCRIYCRRETC